MGRIGLIGDNSVGYIKKLIQIWNEGECAVLIDWRIPNNIAVEMMKEANVSRCYIDSKLAARCSDDCVLEGIEFILFEGSSSTCEFIAEDIYELYLENYCEDEAVILYSSGTTGKAKGIILSHYAISINADLVLEYMKLSECDCLYIVKTLAHSSTLVGELLVGLKAHIRILISPTISNPRKTLQNINEHNVTTICVNPTLLELYIKTVGNRKWTFNSLKTIYTSGAIADAALIEEAQNTIVGVQILNVYGLSEAGPRISAQRSGERRVIGSVGKVLRNVNIVIVSESGEILPPRYKGIIHVNTPCLFSGYVAATIVRKSLYNDWFNTGDIGYVDEENNLFITGRVDNMITVGSHNVYPEEVEYLIKTKANVKDCIICSQKNSVYGNKIICYYVADFDLASELNEYCVANLAPYEIPSEFMRIENIPVTNNGKKTRKLNGYL